MSITLTTVTTMVAFLLSSFSSIRAIRWLGCYALFTIFVDAVYQVTFYIALLVLDERRIKANRRDVCFWIVVRTEESPANSDNNKDASHNHSVSSTSSNDEKSHNSNSEVEIQPVRNQSGGQDKAANGAEPKDPSECRHVTTATMDESEVVQLALDCGMEEDTSRREAGAEETHMDTHNFADRFMTWYARRVVPNRGFQLVVCMVFLMP